MTSPQTHQFTPIEFLRRPNQRQFDYGQVRLDPIVGQAISDAYMAAAPWQPHALPAYQAFRDETAAQFQLLVHTIGVRVEAVPYDPYPHAATMAADLRSGQLLIYSTKDTGNPHPLLGDAENDMFRAVHDAFGHAAIGCGFDRDGEEAAWLHHRTMYSPLARPALATETRGQNCAKTFHYRDRQFPVQKLILLPAKFI